MPNSKANPLLYQSTNKHTKQSSKWFIFPICYAVRSSKCEC